MKNTAKAIWDTICEFSPIVGACIGMLIAYGFAILLTVGIPAAAIVWIIQAIKS